jgi:hypothetical protein
MESISPLLEHVSPVEWITSRSTANISFIGSYSAGAVKQNGFSDSDQSVQRFVRKLKATQPQRICRIEAQNFAIIRDMSVEKDKPRVHSENIYRECLVNAVGSARELHKSLDEVLDDVRKQWRDMLEIYEPEEQ